MIRQTRRLLSLAVIGFVFTACTSENGATVPVAVPSNAQTAIVQRSTVVGVLTLKGVVVQGAVFQLHTNTAGVVTEVDAKSVTITPSNGSALVTIIAPVGSRLDQTLVNVNDKIISGMTVATAVSLGFTVGMEMQPADLVRFVSPPLGARAQVDGGPGPFDCPLVDDIPTTVMTNEATAGNPILFCAIPDDTRVLAGMPATAVIQLEKAENALVLPVEAVAGTIDSGSVYLQGNDGQPIVAPVKLGTTDGVRVVILDGLKEGDVVFVPGPWLG